MAWQPIETVPLDGEQYLVARRITDPPFVSMSVAQWVEPEGMFLANMVWFPAEEFGRIHTHWHELPTPPRPDA